LFHFPVLLGVTFQFLFEPFLSDIWVYFVSF